jgi:polysaccharide pyruvyl transferase WcaK-like protein
VNKEQSMVRRVVVTSVFSDDNKGGAALTAAAIDVLREAFPGSALTLVSIWHRAEHLDALYRHTKAYAPDVEIVPAPVGVSAGPFAGLRAALRTVPYFFGRAGAAAPPAVRRVLEADLVVCKAGYHTFKDKESLPGLLSLWLTAFPFLLGIRRGIPTVVMPSAIGPFTHGPSRWLNALILRRTSLILARDTRSERDTLALGVDRARVAQVADGAFAIATPTPAQCRAAAERFGLGGARFASMTAMGYGTRDQIRAFVHRLEAVARQMLDQNVVDRIAVVLQDESDREPSEALVKQLNDPRVAFVQDDLPPHQLVALYGAGAVTIATRLHSAIFSFVGGTPAIGIPMAGTKTQGIFEGLGLQRLLAASSTFEPAELVAAAQRAVTGGDALRTDVGTAVARTRADAARVIEFMRSVAQPSTTTSSPAPAATRAGTVHEDRQ